MEQINVQFKIPLGSYDILITLGKGFINSSFLSPGYLHSHPFIEIHFIISGLNRIKMSDGAMTVGEGDVLIVPPEISHAIIPLHSDGKYKRAVFILEISKYRADPDYPDSGGEYVNDVFSSVNEVLVFKDTFDGCTTIEEIQNELIRKPPGYETKLKSEFTSLLIELCRCIGAGSTVTAPHLIKPLNESQLVIIEDYMSCNKKCSEEELAKIMHISRRQLNRVLNKLYGKSFRLLLLDLRMSMANDLIEETRFSYNQIAVKIGYNSVNAFYHAYSRYYNITPDQYRQRKVSGR